MAGTFAQLAVLTLATALVGCGGNEPDRNPLGADAGAAATDGAIDLDGGDDGGQRFDVGGTSSAGGNGGDAGLADGCKKVDLLFVIDDSGSMADEQANLISSFPGFIGGIKAQLADTDGYHVGITTSDVYGGSFGDLQCVRDGTMVTATSGQGSSARDCSPYAGGGRYMTEADDLATAFSCAAQVGVGGDGDEKPMEMMVSAVSPGQVGPGGCNEGFLRDDALLVVVVITDEEDDHETMGCPTSSGVNSMPNPGSNGEPAGWYAALVAAKGGVESSIVMLALVGPDSEPSCPALDKCSGGIEGAEVAHRIIELTQMFTYGFVGPICQPYAPFFAEAIGHIKSACDDFVPVG